jgi:hypothetical protein
MKHTPSVLLIAVGLQPAYAQVRGFHKLSNDHECCDGH